MTAKTYLVGGACRDLFLGIEPKDRDYVVVGSTEQAMLDQGFVRVGAQFPTFLHPVTKAEYALARTERKCGIGHTGFAVVADPTVTIEGMNYICLDKKLLDQFQEAGFNIYDDYTIEELTQAFRRITQSDVRD